MKIFSLVLLSVVITAQISFAEGHMAHMANSIKKGTKWVLTPENGLALISAGCFLSGALNLKKAAAAYLQYEHPWQEQLKPGEKPVFNALGRQSWQKLSREVAQDTFKASKWMFGISALTGTVALFFKKCGQQVASKPC